ncbi:MAG: putative Ig domain-containing protein [Bacteroidota bacterium]
MKKVIGLILNNKHSMKLKVILISFLSVLVFSNIAFAQTTFTSIANGKWGDASTWDQGNDKPGTGDDVIVTGGYRVTIANAAGRCRHLTIDAGNVLDVNNNGDMTVSGNLTVNGIVTRGGSKLFNVTGVDGDILSGTGYLDDINFIIEGNMQVVADADLTFIGSFTIKNGVTVTNNGSISTDNLLGEDNLGTAVWTNNANSTLSVGGELFPASNMGTLNAHATGNTVRYYDVATVVKIPTAGYYNLVIEGDQKTLGGPTIVLNDITLSGILDADVTNNYSLTVGGNWTNNSIFYPRQGTVTLDGDAVQNVSEETFYNLVVDNSSEGLILSGNVVVANELTMTAGNINTGSDKITVGISATDVGILSYSSGTVIGTYEKWFAVTTTTEDVVFPVGTSDYYRPITIASPAIVTTAGVVIARFVESSPGALKPPGYLDDDVMRLYNTFSEGYWDLSADGNFSAGGNYNILLTGNGFSSFTIDNASTRIVTREPSKSWDLSGTHGVVSGSVVSRDGLDAFPAQFAFADTTNCEAPEITSFTGDQTVCTGATNVTYSINNDNDESECFWTVVGGTIISENPTTTHNVVVSWDATGQVGSVEVYKQNGCTQSFPESLTVNVHPIAPASIDGKQYVAKGATDVIYSVDAITDYTYSWSISPTSNDSIKSGQNTNEITVNWSDDLADETVTVTATHADCPASASTTLIVHKYDIITSVQDGSWDDETTWDCSCIPTSGENVRVKHNVTAVEDADGDPISIVNLIVESSGNLIYNPVADQDFTVTGAITVNGIITTNSMNGTENLVLTGTSEANSQIDGIGTITAANDVIISYNKNILQATDLVIEGNLDLQTPEGFTVKNNGIVEVTGNLNIATSSGWQNAAGSTLIIGSAVSTTGGIDAQAVGNTVEYNGAAQNIKAPSPSYYNLLLSGTATKTASGVLEILGDLTISESGSLDVANYNITLSGNWINSSTDADSFIEGTGTVTFDGDALQTITRDGGVAETFYNFEIANSAGVDLASNVNISNNLILTSGTINTSSTNILSMTSTSGMVTGGSNSTFVNGPMIKYIAGSGSFTFPVGKSGRFGESSVSNATVGNWQAEYFNQNPLVENYDPTEIEDQVDDPDLLFVSQNEYWKILGPTGGTAQVTLRWDATSAVPSDVTLREGLKVAQWTTVPEPDAWFRLTTDIPVGNESLGTLTTSGVITLDPIQVFTIGSVVANDISWTGNTDTDWATGTNWDDGYMPSSMIDRVTIPNTINQPIITSSAVVGDLTINADAVLSVNSNFSLTVNGDFVNNGTLNLKASNNHDPSGSFIPMGSVSGAVNVELYTSADKWYYIMSPITTTFSYSVIDNSPPPNIYYHYSYDETYNCPVTIPNSDPSNWEVTEHEFWRAWVYPGSVVEPETGYIISDDVDKTITFSGSIKTDDYTTALTLTQNDGNGDAYDGWSLIGNPYTSALDWDNAAIDKTNIGGAVYYYSNVNDNYDYYLDGSTFLNNATRYIPAMQAFFVKATADGNLTIPKTARVHNEQKRYKSAGQADQLDFMKVKLSANNFTDESILRFHDNATNGFDSQLDAYKRFTSNKAVPQVYFKLNDNKESLAINSLPVQNYDLTVQLGVNVQAGSDYVFEFSQIDFPGYFVCLEDKLTSETVILQPYEQYTFDYVGGESTERFLIHFVKNRAPAVNSVIPDNAIEEDKQFSYQVPADAIIDLDIYAGDVLTYSAKLENGEELPTWLTFIPDTRTFSGLPVNSDVAILNIQLIVTDFFGEEVSDIFVLEVVNVNDAPELANEIPDQEVDKGSSYSYTVPVNTFNDIDLGDVLQLSVKQADGSGLPQWLIFDLENGKLYGTAGEVGDINIVVTATDIEGASVTDEFILTVKSTTGINSLSSSEVTMYPNPTKGLFFVKTDYYRDDLMIIVRDFNGRVIKQVKPKGKETEINISEFSSGMYFIELNNKVESRVFKIDLNK